MMAKTLREVLLDEKKQQVEQLERNRREQERRRHNEKVEAINAVLKEANKTLREIADGEWRISDAVPFERQHPSNFYVQHGEDDSVILLVKTLSQGGYEVYYTRPIENENRAKRLASSRAMAGTHHLDWHGDPRVALAQFIYEDEKQKEQRSCSAG